MSEEKPQRISYERAIRVFDDDHGWYVYVGPDCDGLGLCAIRYVEGETGSDWRREIIIPWAHAEAVARAILELTYKRADPT